MLSARFDPPPLDLELAPDEIHIWFAVLSQPACVLHGFIQILSNEERIRAEKFHFERDRRRFIVRRGVLRTILGYYLNDEPGRLHFAYGKHGKPKVANTFGNRAVHFNLSHSNEIALFAFARYREIGVDIEYMRDVPEMEGIVEQFFAIKEREIFRSLPENQKREAFFKGWTCKEAIVKAFGDGLFRPLDKFEVSLVPGEPAMLRLEGDARKASRWSIQDLTPAPKYVGAFAVTGPRPEEKLLRWDVARMGGVFCEYTDIQFP